MTDMRTASRQMRRAAAKFLQREASKWPVTLKRLPESEFPKVNKPGMRVPVEIWRSRDFLLQVFLENGNERLSVNRTSIKDDGNWREDISWEDLQRLKSECGRGDKEAVEIYPRDDNVVNVANMRHLWVLKDSLPFGW